jgi:peptidyl-prolyl cis-trans isomerase D
MLDLVRKHARSWLIKVALFLIVLVFIFWGGYSYKNRQESQMARVGDAYISINEYHQYYQQLLEMYRRQLGSSLSEDMLRDMNLKKQALNLLVDRYLIARAAQDLGLAATTMEVQQQLLRYPVFQTDGQFDQKRYLFILRQNRMSPETFELQAGQDLSLQKVEAFIKRRALVTEAELQADFRFNYTLIELAYALFDPIALEGQVNADEKVLADFYQQHQDRYKDLEKRQVSYMLFNLAAYLSAVQVTDDQIREDYEDHAAEYHQEQEVRARHILLGVKEDASEADIAKVRTEAEKVLLEAKHGKDFTELARKYSNDPTVNENGGDLGFFTRGRMVPEFSEAAFNMKAGEISDLVRTPYGFHIIKVEEVHPEKNTPIEDVRGQIEARLKGEKARDIAFQKARNFADAAYAQKDVNKAAQAMTPPTTAVSTWVSQKETVPEVGGLAPQSMTKLLALPEKGISDVMEVPKGFLIAQVEVIKPPEVIPFEKVKNRLDKDYRVDQARTLAQKNASELLTSARDLKSLEAAGKQAKVEVKKSGWFSRQEPDKDLPGLQGDTQNTVFDLQEAQPFPEAPLMLGNRYAVVQLLGRKLPEDLLEKERSTIAARLEGEKQGLVWQTWLGEERKRTPIEIYREP